MEAIVIVIIAVVLFAKLCSPHNDRNPSIGNAPSYSKGAHGKSSRR